MEIKNKLMNSSNFFLLFKGLLKNISHSEPIQDNFNFETCATFSGLS